MFSNIDSAALIDKRIWFHPYTHTQRMRNSFSFIKTSAATVYSNTAQSKRERDRERESTEFSSNPLLLFIHFLNIYYTRHTFTICTYSLFFIVHKHILNFIDVQYALDSLIGIIHKQHSQTNASA